MLKFGEAVQGLGHIVYLRFDITVPEIAVQSLGIDILRGESIEIMVETLAGHAELAGHDAVAQLDDVVEETAEPCRVEHSLGEGIARIEQHQVGMLRRDAEVAAQHTEVEQQLGIVLLELHASFGVGALYLDVIVLARFLLDEHPEIGRHEVDAAVDAELLTDERGLQNG